MYTLDCVRFANPMTASVMSGIVNAFEAVANPVDAPTGSHVGPKEFDPIANIYPFAYFRM